MLGDWRIADPPEAGISRPDRVARNAIGPNGNKRKDDCRKQCSDARSEESTAHHPPIVAGYRASNWGTTAP